MFILFQIIYNKNNLNNLNSVFSVLLINQKQIYYKLSRQNSFDGGTDMFKDCSSPGRSKMSREKDLHKIALKNSFRFYQKPQLQVEDNQINHEQSEVSELIKRHNSSELIKMNRTDHDIQSPKKVE